MKTQMQLLIEKRNELESTLREPAFERRSDIIDQLKRVKGQIKNQAAENNILAVKHEY